MQATAKGKSEVNTSKRNTALLLAGAMVLITAASVRLRADTGMCGGASTTLPFTDVPSSNAFFCSIAEAFFSGLTNGTSQTTYSPSASVPREQMAAFVTRTMDQSIKRSSSRAALDQFWTSQTQFNLTQTTVGIRPTLVKSDGPDVWVANKSSGTVSRVRASDGSKVGNDWTGAVTAHGVLVAMGRVFVTGSTFPAGSLYVINPENQNGGAVTVIPGLGGFPEGIAFDGERIWTANAAGSISIIALPSYSVLTISGFFSQLHGIIYDGHNIWVTDGDRKLKKLDSSGNILMSVSVGSLPLYPAFDGTNIWVPNAGSNTVSVVRASTGAVVAVLNGNGLSNPVQAAFDGERILVTNSDENRVSLWKASDLTPIGTFSTGAGTIPGGVCSDGLNFWIALEVTGTPAPGTLARF
jgi:DNA-binding beta-propeller fold protein YncE